jgi:hypothetical protein
MKPPTAIPAIAPRDNPGSLKTLASLLALALAIVLVLVLVLMLECVNVDELLVAECEADDDVELVGKSEASLASSKLAATRSSMAQSPR